MWKTGRARRDKDHTFLRVYVHIIYIYIIQILVVMFIYLCFFLFPSKACVRTGRRGTPASLWRTREKPCSRRTIGSVCLRYDTFTCIHMTILSKHFLFSQWHVYSKNRFLECLEHANWWQGAHLSPSLVVSLSLFSSVKYHIELFTDSSQPSSLTLNIAGHLTRHERREWREESQSVFSTLCATDHHSLELCLHLIFT